MVMTIAEARERCKRAIAAVPRDALIIGVLVLASSGSFGLGYLEGEQEAAKVPISIEVTGPAPSQVRAGEGKYVASKNGSKYYLASCGGAARISEANKVWFDSALAAQAAGYTPAANCPGL